MSDDGDDDWFESAFGDEESDDSEATAADERRDEPDEDAPATGNGGAFDAGGDGEFDGRDEDRGASAFGDVGTGTESAFGDTGSGGQFDGDGADFGGGGGDGGLFDEDFAQAMGGAGGGDAEFDDDDFESDIPRLDLGIEGLDNMIQGGLPLRHLIVIVGGAGTGKTTFGLQFLQHGLEKEDTDRGVFITLEQTHDDIISTAAERGWEFERHEEEGNLAVVDLDPVEMANSLDNIRGELPALIEDFGADRFVLDSVSLLEMMYDDVSRRRTEVFDFTQSLKQAGVTTVLTSEANEDNPYASRHGIIEYLTDAVFLLRYVRSETQETRLAVEIQKIRNANHSRETKPYEITLDGISVYEQANIF
ncbi:KaiC domain-containing protein [Halosimplex aquaticum]|uniref:KaiC domain-containing protein n=1 Tax=Halosimplex aquaticum TaxID=3026162 RepID=A0ABD5Y4E1_9EURY|nr:KaiC domain-containing protein [Halosimplex aquaticum]